MGPLPWQTKKNKAEVQHLKRAYRLADSVPAVLRDMAVHLSSRGFGSMPDYNYLEKQTLALAVIHTAT